jgi:hypothetical protein
MVAKEVFVNYYNFSPIWVQHASIHVKYSGTQVKKGKCQGIFLIKFIQSRGAGAGAANQICGSAEPESEPKEISSPPQHCFFRRK